MTNQSHKVNMKREKIAASAYRLCEAAITNTPNLVFKAAEVPGPQLRRPVICNSSIRRARGSQALKRVLASSSPNFSWLSASTGTPWLLDTSLVLLPMISHVMPLVTVSVTNFFLSSVGTSHWAVRNPPIHWDLVFTDYICKKLDFLEGLGGSVGICCTCLVTKFDPRNPWRGGRVDLTPQNCPLTFTNRTWYVCASHMCMHSQPDILYIF